MKMKVKSTINGYDLTKDKIYDVIYEYDNLYKLKCDSEIYWRNKDFFEIVEHMMENI